MSKALLTLFSGLVPVRTQIGVLFFSQILNADSILLMNLYISPRCNGPKS